MHKVWGLPLRPQVLGLGKSPPGGGSSQLALQAPVAGHRHRWHMSMKASFVQHTLGSIIQIPDGFQRALQLWGQPCCACTHMGHL